MSHVEPDNNERRPRQEQSVIWIIWWTYGAFYFCRVNLAAAVAGMQQPLSEGGLELTGMQVGMILASLKLTYGIGQFVNGQLAEFIRPRVLLMIGMFGSAALNVAFGLATGFYFLLFVWACNGYCQALGWTPCVRVMGNWIPVFRRGWAIGIVGTGYQFTLGLTYLVSTQAAAHFGWRGALLVPSIILALSGVFMLLFLREQPPESDKAEGDPGTEHQPRTTSPRQRLPIIETLWLTLTNPALWLLGLSLGLLNACRYGFVDWGIAHLMEVQETGVGAAGLKYVVLPIGAIVGSYTAGWATDRFFGSRRAPVICVLLVLLGILTLVYEQVSQVSTVGTIALLGVVGFCVYGPQVLLVGTAPADLARQGTAAAAAGFVNFMGYMGAAMGDTVTGYVKEPEHGGWQVAIQIWAGWAFAAALVVALLWNTRARSAKGS